MKSYMQKKETVERKWYVIDAEGKPLGRVASKTAHMLRGTNIYTTYRLWRLYHHCKCRKSSINW